MSAPRRSAWTALVGLSLAGCALPVPTPSPPPVLVPGGAVLADQSDAIVADTLAEIAAADEAKDPSLLSDRVGGDAALARAAEYVVASKGGSAPDTFPSGVLAVYATDSTDWPRALVTVTEAPDEKLTPVVMVWIQDDARSPYQFREWAHMLPGAIVPAMPNQSVGADLVPLDAEGYSMTPQEAIDAYVDLLTTGEPEEATFAADTYRERMFAARAALSKAAKGRKGTYADKIAARPDEAFAFETAEGGALVFVPVTVTSVFTVPGAQLSLPAADKALLSGTLSDRVVHHYRDLIVISVPKDASLLPSVVAADHHLVDVTLKEDG